MQIGELAQQTGTSTKAIRYYEEIGVLPEPARAENGYRIYGIETVDRLSFVKDAQATGLSLDEITAILEQREQGETTCQHIIELLERQLTQIDDRIEQLNSTRTALAAITERARELDPANCLDPNRCQTITPAADAQSRHQFASVQHPVHRH
jgi:DNA-binding transcriptional MerR regulator